MENVTPLSLINLFDTTKEERKKFVQIAISQLLDGHTDVKYVHYSLKCIEQIITEIMDNQSYKDMLLESVESYGKKMQFKNAEYSISESSVDYDFTICNDSIINDLERQLSILKDGVKTRKEFLKKLPIGGIEIFDSMTGEISHIYPPSKSSKTIVKTKLA